MAFKTDTGKLDISVEARRKPKLHPFAELTKTYLKNLYLLGLTHLDQLRTFSPFRKGGVRGIFKNPSLPPKADPCPQVLRTKRCRRAPLAETLPLQRERT